MKKMEKILKVNNNENLLRNTFQFLTVKDFSIISQVSHLFKKSSNYFNVYWREYTKNLFCSYIDHYNLLNTVKENKNEDFKDNTDWKIFLRLGVEIRNSWEGIRFKKDDQNQEVIFIRNELYSTLKEFYSLPKLRKENLHVETELNTILQTNLYDYVYDQQDLYDYYDPYLKDFSDRLFDPNCNNFELKTPGVYFESCLLNFEEQLNTFDNSSSKLSLAKLRWYHLEDEISLNDLDISLNRKSSSIIQFEDVENSYKFCPFNLSFSSLNENKKKYENNALLQFFYTMIISVTYFCKLNYKIFLNNSSDDSIFLNEYIKRHKSYTDAAIYLNDQFENFNVLINYIYENSFKNYPDYPKFSVLRLMMIIWHREVLGPLEEQNLVSNKLITVFKKYIIKEINKTFEINNSNFKIKVKDSCFKENLKEDLDVNFSLEEYNSFNHVSSESLHINKTFVFNSVSSMSTNLSSFSTQNSFTQQSSFSKDKNIVNEEFTSFDYHTDYFIEQTLNSLLDFSSNEFSIYFINSSKMNVNKYYENIENKIVSFIDDLTKNFKKPKFELLLFFKNSDFIRFKLINRTRMRVISTICNNMLKISSDEISILFEEYIIKSSNTTIQDAQFYLKLHGDLPDLIYEKIYEKLIELLSKKNLDGDLCKYLSLNFIRESLKIKNHPIFLYEDSIEWLKNEESIQSETDELIDNENAKRQISLKRDHEEKLYNFTSNLSWENIVQIYNYEIKPKIKSPNKFLDLSTTSNLELIETNNNNQNENDNNNSIDIDIISIGKP